MRRRSYLSLGLLLVAQLTGAVSQVLPAAEGTSPTEWATGLPEDVGLDSGVLAEMFDYARQHEIPVHSVQIVRHGRLVLDSYFYPYRVEMRHDVASVTKSVTSTLIGLAIQKGYLHDVHQSIVDLFPDRSFVHRDERKSRVTLEHLLMMEVGWDCGFEPKEARLYEMRRTSDWLQFMLDLPMVAEPGTRFAYCSGNPHVLSIILGKTTGTNALAFARSELLGPLGISDVAWPADPSGNNYGWGDLQLRPRDMAKLGQLFLQRGRWGERQILSESWVHTATDNHVERTVNKDHYGYAWWVKGEDRPGMFEAVGRGGQRINVWPLKDVVTVFTGGGFEPGDLGQFIVRSLRSDDPLPANPEAASRLRDRIMAAAKPPPPQPIKQAPATAERISAKPIKMSANGLGVQELTLTFDGKAEAKADLRFDGHIEHLLVGLDGVERSSTNAQAGLPIACKGEWVAADAFLLQVDLVGRINFYKIKLTFSAHSSKVDVTLNERTGLNDEEFSGVLAE